MLCSTSLAMILFTAVPGVILIYQLAVVNALNIRVSLASFMYSCSIGISMSLTKNSKSIGVFHLQQHYTKRVCSGSASCLPSMYTIPSTIDRLSPGIPTHLLRN
jgi:hypothetical protein